MKNRFVAIALLAFLPKALSAQAPPEPKAGLIRVIVLDTSGSMTGDRIASAKDEIGKAVHAMPPTKDQPVIVVPFHDAPHDVAAFTDLAAFDAHFARLDAGGGTCIAKGLQRARKEIDKFPDSRQMMVLFYSDGEDPDAAGIAAAEEELNKLFAVRHRQGLPTLVFCKRWENANANLLQKISARGHAQVIDAGELKVVPVTVKPVVAIGKATWSQIKPLTLELAGDVRLDMKGLPFDPAAKSVSLRVANHGAIATPLDVRPGDPKSTPFSMELPVPADALKAGKIDLQLALDQLAHVTTKDSVALPQIDSSPTQVTLPPRTVAVKITAVPKATEPTTWSDPLSAKPLWKGKLEGRFDSLKDGPWPTPVRLRVNLATGALKSPDTFEISAPGIFSVPLLVEGVPVMSGATTFAVDGKLTSDTANFQLNPSIVAFRLDAPTPVPEETTIAFRVDRVSNPRWIDLAKGCARFEVDGVCVVTGRILPKTKVILVHTSQIRALDIQPPIFFEGSQPVRLVVDALLSAPPATSKFSIDVVPPAASAALRFPKPAPIRFEADSPPALQTILVAANGEALELFVREPEAPLTFVGVPVLSESVDESLARGVTVGVRPGVNAASSSGHALFEPLSVPIAVPPLDRSFFFDSVFDVSLDVLPQPPSPALVGSQQPLRVVIEAPFKRVLLYLALAVSAVVGTAMFLRVVFARSSDEITNRTS